MLENRAISGKRTVNENSLSGPPNQFGIGENSDSFALGQVRSIISKWEDELTTKDAGAGSNE